MKQDGFTLVELIVAISLLAFGIIGAYSFMHPASLLISNSSYRLTADYLAQEGLEVVKNIRDNNITFSGNSWSETLTTCQTGCELDYKTGTSVESPENQLKVYSDTFLNLNADGLHSYDAGTPTKFKRKVTITQPSPSSNILKVDVMVMWEYSGQSFSFDTIGYIYNLL